MNSSKFRENLTVIALAIVLMTNIWLLVDDPLVAVAIYAIVSLLIVLASALTSLE